jgi:hypothetical protein
LHLAGFNPARRYVSWWVPLPLCPVSVHGVRTHRHFLQDKMCGCHSPPPPKPESLTAKIFGAAADLASWLACQRPKRRFIHSEDISRRRALLNILLMSSRRAGQTGERTSLLSSCRSLSTPLGLWTGHTRNVADVLRFRCDMVV